MIRDKSLFSCILVIVFACILLGIVQIVHGTHFEKMCTETLQGEVVEIQKESLGMTSNVSVTFKLDGLLHKVTNLVSYRFAKHLSIGDKVLVYYNPKDKTQYYAVDYCAFDVFSVSVALCWLVLLGYLASRRNVDDSVSIDKVLTTDTTNQN